MELGDASDHELWQRVNSGDDFAFHCFYERYANDVYRFLLRRTANWSVAEELTAEVFIVTWRRRGAVQLDTQSGLRPWLFAVALNVQRNYLRSNRRQGQRVPLEAVTKDVPDIADLVASRIDDARTLATVLAALRELSAPDRELLHLCLWQDMAPAQIALVLELDAGVVRTRLSRARRRLLNQLLPELTQEVPNA